MDLEKTDHSSVEPSDMRQPVSEVSSSQKIPVESEFTTRSCTTLLGTFLALFCSFGFVNAFGVFQEYYAQHILSGSSASDISWIGSCNIFVLFGGAIVPGILTDKYGPRILICIGSVITLLAVFMTSLCKEYYQFFLAQAILLGIGITFLFCPAITVLSLHFKANRGLALGVSVAGSSLGGIIWPIALHKLFDQVGFGWAVRIIGFIMMPCLGVACLTISAPENKLQGRKKTSPTILLKNPPLFLLSSGLFLSYFGLFSPFFYITPYAISVGIDSDMAFYLVSVINAASFFGRILPGFWADRFGKYNLIVVSTGLSGIICMCWSKANSLAGVVVFSIAYGFCSGALISLQGACAAQVVGPELYGTAMGLMMLVLSISGLTGTPIAGQLLGHYGYVALSVFSGVCMLAGAFVMAVARFMQERRLMICV